MLWWLLIGISAAKTVCFGTDGPVFNKVNKGNHPQMALIQISKLLLFTHYADLPGRNGEQLCWITKWHGKSSVGWEDEVGLEDGEDDDSFFRGEFWMTCAVLDGSWWLGSTLNTVRVQWANFQINQGTEEFKMVWPQMRMTDACSRWQG